MKVGLRKQKDRSLASEGIDRLIASLLSLCSRSAGTSLRGCGVNYPPGVAMGNGKHRIHWKVQDERREIYGLILLCLSSARKKGTLKR